MEHTVLVVEDEKGIRDAIAIYLKNQPSSPRRDLTGISVRLACVRRAASVRPEPGSNS